MRKIPLDTFTSTNILTMDNAVDSIPGASPDNNASVATTSARNLAEREEAQNSRGGYFLAFSLYLNRINEYRNPNLSIYFTQKPIRVSVDTLPSSSTSQKPNAEVAGLTKKSPAQAIVDIIKLDESKIMKPEVSAPFLGKTTR